MNPTSRTLAARCLSAAGRWLPAPTGMRRPSALLLALTTTAMVASAATHMFVPGHGLTDRSSGQHPNAPIEDLIAQCNLANTGNPITQSPPVVKWMRVIEKQYDWGTLENNYLKAGGSSNNPQPQHRNWKDTDPDTGIYQIRADAEKCADAGLVLRVVLLHKYANFPTYMVGTGANLNRHTVEFTAGQGSGNVERVIKLEQANDLNSTTLNTLGVLEGLYDKVIETLKGSEKARRGFYGFVIQETSIGSTPYYDDGSPAANQRKSDWYANLRAFHQFLGAKLATFNNAGTNPYTPPGRLFWQMLNTPWQGPATNRANSTIAQIVDALPDGAGLCGPDVFPREPVNPNNTETHLYKVYDREIRGNTQRPVSLRVASSNYYTDRAHFDPNVIIGVQPIWTPGSSNLPGPYGFDNKNAGDGIANFVGVVSVGNAPDNLGLHNVIWTWDDGTLAQYNGLPLAESPDGLPLESAQNQPYGAWGWEQVKKWMNDTDNNQSPDQFPRGNTGGCNAAVPLLIQ